MSVTNHAPEYQSALDQWQLVKDCVKGEEAVKYRKTRYLPMPSPTDMSKENTSRYDQYRKRAQFVNYTGRTKRALIGSVFRKRPIVSLPPQIDYLTEDASRNGITLQNLIKLSTGDVLETGRAGLLADYPQAEEGLTLAETQANRGYVIHYEATAIINWHISQAGVLDLVVLRESEEVQQGTSFDYVSERRYRVLQLVDGVYQQSYYDEGGVLVWTATPRKSDGSVFQEIPFAWIGAEDNDETIDVAPLADIARVNIGHYRNSADYEESCFMVGQPTPVVSGLTQSWVEQVGQNGYTIGSRSAWLLPEGGSAELMQAAPNQLPSEAMRHKEEQMVAIGARIIQDSSGQETAEAARIRHSGENSMLTTVVENVEAAYIRVITWIGEFMGVDVTEENTEITLNKEFFDSRLSAQEVMAIIQLGASGVVGIQDQRQMVRSGRIEIEADRTDEDIEGDLQGDAGIL